MASSLSAPGGTEKCCQVPGKSAKRKSTMRTLLSLIELSTSSAVAQLRNMGCLPSSAALPCCYAETLSPLRNQVEKMIKLKMIAILPCRVVKRDSRDAFGTVPLAVRFAAAG